MRPTEFGDGKPIFAAFAEFRQPRFSAYVVEGRQLARVGFTHAHMQTPIKIGAHNGLGIQAQRPLH